MADIKRKSMYQEPAVEVCTVSTEDVLTTSPGTMSWDDDWGDFNSTRDNTFFDE